jgi:LPXTG-motif cell wall-anchored protein
MNKSGLCGHSNVNAKEVLMNLNTLDPNLLMLAVVGILLIAVLAWLYMRKRKEHDRRPAANNWDRPWADDTGTRAVTKSGSEISRPRRAG